MDKLEWYVYVNKFNEGIVQYNIFDNYPVKASVTQLYKQFGDNKEKFFEELNKVLAYLFLAKYEWEITIHDWTPSADFDYLKVDVYKQIRMNWNAFKAYVWEELA